MMNKTQITIVTTNNKFSTALKAKLNGFAKRNPQYRFVVGDIAEMNRNRIVFIVSDKFSYIKSQVIKRIAFANYRPNGNLQTFVYTLDTGCKPIPVGDYKAVTRIENDLHDEYLQTQIDIELNQYKYLTTLYTNPKVVWGCDSSKYIINAVYERFGDIFNQGHRYTEFCIQCMQAEINESGFDFYTAGNLVSVEKMSNYTAMEDSEFMSAGETSSHTELRIKEQYQTLMLDTIRNWTQLQYYTMYKIEPDVRDDFDLIKDINVDWCHSRPLFDTSDLSDIRSTAKLDRDYRHACNHGSAIFSE